jgi:hypothetical protein
MAGKLGRFQAQAFQGWASEVTKQNHLGTFMMLHPQKATNIMVQLLAVNRGKTLDAFLSQFSVKEFENDHDYTWDIIGSSRRNIPLLYAIDENGNKVTSSTATMVGVHKAPFELVFGEDWFFDGEVVLGELNEVYPLRILGPAKYMGNTVSYTVELMGGVMSGMDPQQLLPGKRFSYSFAPVSRGLSREAGGVRHVAPASMRNEFTTIRIHDKLSGDLFNEKIAFGIPVVKQSASGRMEQTTETMWMHLENWELEKTWSEYKSNALAYGVSNRNNNGEYLNFDKSGEVIRMGDGIYKQIEVANTHYYNKFSLDLLDDILYDLTTNVIGMEDRTFVLKTGQAGAIKFHKAVKEETSGWFNMEIDAAHVGAIAKTSSPLHSNALKAGYQFTEWLAPNGISVKLDVDPSYDDNVRNKVLLQGKPAMSSRFDIFDMGTSKEANIFKCVVKNKPEARGYEWGIYNPFTGAYGNENMSHAEDSATVHIMTSLGACVLDPTRTVSLIPAVLQA